MSEPNSASSDEAPLALCLSGGGLRATLFHLGVLQALRAARRGGRSALESIGEIYSVSGGSILAAHLVLNWEKYCGTEDEFQAVAKQVREFAQRDIRNRVIRRWIGSNLLIVPRLIGRGSRTYWLQQEYESLYARACLDDLDRGGNRSRPKLHILSTSFRTGEMCSFSAGQFELSTFDRANQSAKPVDTPAGLISVAFAVTASSAFPPLFPPVRLTDRMLGVTDIVQLQGVTDLSDGGVYDNLGAEKLIYDRSIGRSQARTVVLSNAGASFQTEQKASLWGIVSRNVRASDIMMRRSADSTDHRIGLEGMEVVDIRIGSKVKAAYLSEHTQIRLKRIRTDLDRFTPMLADMLMAHGYAAGLSALRERRFEAGDAGAQAPKESAERLDREAVYAAKRKALTLDPKDWTTYALGAFVLALFTAFFWSTAMYSVTYVEARERERDLVQGQLNAVTKAATDRALDEAAMRAKAETQIAQLLAENESLKAELKSAGKETVEPGSDNGDYQLWIQFAGSLQRQQMIDFGARIMTQWPNMPGANRGGERTALAAGVREVRYGSPEDLPAALRLTADIDTTGLVASMNSPKRVKGIPPRSLEIWVSR